MQQVPALTIRCSTVPNASASGLDQAAGPQLQAALDDSRADGIYLYRFDRAKSALELVCYRGLTASVTAVEVQAGVNAATWLLSLKHSTRIDDSAWLDKRLNWLPEFAQNRFRSAIALPLTAEATLAGLLTAGRLGTPAFTKLEAGALLGLRSPLESLLAMAAAREDNARLRSELRTLTDRLAGRKQIERAKGMMQSRHGWTEEEAYLHLRRLSRKTRKPMTEIARGVLAHSGTGSLPEAS